MTYPLQKLKMKRRDTRGIIQNQSILKTYKSKYEHMHKWVMNVADPRNPQRMCPPFHCAFAIIRDNYTATMRRIIGITILLNWTIMNKGLTVPISPEPRWWPKRNTNKTNSTWWGIHWIDRQESPEYQWMHKSTHWNMIWDDTLTIVEWISIQHCSNILNVHIIAQNELQGG